MSRHNDMRRIIGALSNIESSSPDYDGDPKDAAVTLIRRSIMFSTAALNANASNVVAANASPDMHRAIANGRVIGGYFLPTANVTAHAANNAQIGVVKLQANGVPVATALITANTAPTANGGVGSLVLGVGVELTPGTGANARFTKGQIIAPQLTQNSAGVAMPVGTIQIDVELEGPASDYPY
jgi:hypothetical protein